MAFLRERPADIVNMSFVLESKMPFWKESLGWSLNVILVLLVIQDGRCESYWDGSRIGGSSGLGAEISDLEGESERGGGLGDGEGDVGVDGSVGE